MRSALSENARQLVTRKILDLKQSTFADTDLLFLLASKPHAGHFGHDIATAS